MWVWVPGGGGTPNVNGSDYILPSIREMIRLPPLKPVTPKCVFSRKRCRAMITHQTSRIWKG